MPPVAHLSIKHTSFELDWSWAMSGSLGLNINPLLLFLLPVGLKWWPWKNDNRLMQKLELGSIAVFQTGLLLPYRRKCKFNYLFVHVSSLQARHHNLNGNRKPIYFLLPILTVVLYWYLLRMFLSNISSLPPGMPDIMITFNPPVKPAPLIYAAVSWINSHLEINGDIAIVRTFFSNSTLFYLNYTAICNILFHCCLPIFTLLNIFSELFIHMHSHVTWFWLRNGLHRQLWDEQSARVFVCPQLHPATLNTLRHCFDLSLSPTIVSVRLSMKGEENFYALPCNLHWAEVNCFHFG